MKKLNIEIPVMFDQNGRKYVELEAVIALLRRETSGAELKQCEAPKCDRFFKINILDGNSARSRFCSGRCRTRSSRNKPKQIVQEEEE